MQDETQVEETTTSPSEENQTTTEGVVETPVVEEKQDKAVPYDRFQEVIQERNKYKELLSTRIEEPKKVEEVPDYDDAIKVVDKRAEDIVNRKFSEITRQMELDKTIAQNPDFFKYADAIKQKIQENPHLSWQDAYKLSKFDIAQYEAREQGKQEAYQSVQEKKRATVESPSKAKATRTISDEAINPLAKGPDGKFLFSTKELEDILPRV